MTVSQYDHVVPHSDIGGRGYLGVYRRSCFIIVPFWGNPPIIDSFPHKGLVMQSFGIFFVSLNELLKTVIRDAMTLLWRHCNEELWMLNYMKCQ